MIAVVNKRAHRPTADDVYIGRPSVWGNPYVIGRDGDRAAVLAKYDAWLDTQPAILARLGDLRGKTLVCWCAPAACHGHVLKRRCEQLFPEKDAA